MQKSYAGIFVIALMVSLLLVPVGTAFGGKNNTNYLNGKPFADLAGQIAANRYSISGLETSTSELRVDLDALRAEMNAVKDRFLANEAGITNLETQMSEVRANYDLSFKEITKIKSEIDDLKSSVTANLVAILELDDTVIANLAAILDLDSNVAANLAAILDLDGDVATNLATIMELDSTISEDISAIQTLNSEMAELESQLDANLQNLSILLEQMKTQLQAESQELSALQVQVDTMNTSVQVQIQALQDEITHLRNQQEATNQNLTVSELAVITVNISYLLSDVVDLNNRITSNTNNINTLQNNFQNHRHRFYDQDRIYLFWILFKAYHYYSYDSYIDTFITDAPSY